MSEENIHSGEDGITISNKLFRVLILGFCLIFIGIILLVISLAQNGSGSIGGVIFIGPIPIVLGAGPDANWLIIISIVIAVVSLVGFFIFTRRSRRIVG